MRTSFLYKTISASLLLLLYLFIATPVQVWHKHGCKKTVQQAKYAENSSVKVASKSAIESTCTICAHQYSVFTNDQIDIIFTASVGLSINYDVVLPLFYDAMISTIADRGPPAIA